MDAILVIDASFCPDTKAAGWAVFAMSDRGWVCCGGPMDLKALTNNVAECIALAKGLQHALAEGIIKDGDRIQCYSDSIFVRDRMRPGEVGRTARRTSRKTGLPPYSRCTDRIPKKTVCGLLRIHNLTLTVTFIHGHTPLKKRKKAHHWMARVDELSRQFMLQQRDLRVWEAYL